MLQKETVHLPLAGGVELKAHGLALDMPRLAVAHNIHFPKPGALSKRYGFESLDAAVAPSRSLLTTGAGNTSSTSYATASVTPAASSLVLVWFAAKRSGGAPSVISVTGNSITYDLVDSQSYDGGLSVLYCYRGMSASPSAGAITILFAASVDAIVWHAEQWANVNTSGSNGSGAIAESAKTSGVAVTSVTPTLVDLADGNAVSVSAAFDDDDGSATFESGWSASINGSAENGANEVKMISARRAAGDSSFTATYSVAADAAGVIVEIKPGLGNYHMESGAAITAAEGMLTRDDELVLSSDGEIYSWSSQVSRWSDAFDAPFDHVGVSSRVVADETLEQYFGDRARYTSGSQSLDCVAWYDATNGVRYQIIDPTTEKVLHRGSCAGTPVRPRVLVVGSYFHIYHMTGNDLKVRTFNASTFLSSNGLTATEATSAALITSTAATVPYAVKLKTATTSIIALRSSATEYKIALVGETGTISVGPTTKVFVAAATTPIDVAYEANTDRIAVFRVNGTPILKADLHNGTTLASVNTDLTIDATPGTVYQITSAFTNVDQGSGVYRSLVVYSADNTNRQTRVKTYLTDNTTGSVSGPSGSTNWAIHYDLASHAFVRGTQDRVYFVAVHRPTTDAAGSGIVVPSGYTRGGSYTLFTSDGMILADMLRLTGSRCQLNGVEDKSAHLPGVAKTEADNYRCVLVDRKSVATKTYGDRTLKDFAFEFGTTFYGVQLGRCAYLPNGFYYDGSGIVEQSFLNPPHAPFANVVLGDSGGANTGLNDNANYGYLAAWEWVNALGERETSSFEVAWTVNTGAAAGDANDVTVNFQGIFSLVGTMKIAATSLGRGHVSLGIFRTEANPPEGAPYYRVTSLDPMATAGNNAHIVNDPTAQSCASWTDAMTDAVLVTKDVFYTTQGEVDNVPIGYYSVLATGQGRLFASGGEDPNRAVYSKLHSTGDVAAFNDALEILFPTTGGPITAIVAQDSQLVVFKERRTYVVQGTGLNNTGLTGGYADPQLVDPSVGCIDARSVVQYPGGILFQSHKGIYNFTGTQVVYVGAPVEDYGLNELSGSLLIEDQHQIVFFLASPAAALNGEVSTVSALMYDYLLGQWATWSGPANVTGAVIWRASPVVCQEDGSTVSVAVQGASKRDLGTPYSMQARTPWIKPAGVQGLGRLWKLGLLGEYLAAHKIRMKFGVDYKTSTWVDDKTWVPTSEPYQVRVGPSRKKLTAFRVDISDESDGASVLDDSADWTALSIEMGVHGGVVRTPLSRSI